VCVCVCVCVCCVVLWCIFMCDAYVLLTGLTGRLTLVVVLERVEVLVTKELPLVAVCNCGASIRKRF